MLFMQLMAIPAAALIGCYAVGHLAGAPLMKVHHGPCSMLMEAMPPIAKCDLAWL
jgi:hypothetical protein